MEKLTTKPFGTKKWLKFCAMVKDVVKLWSIFISTNKNTSTKQIFINKNNLIITITVSEYYFLKKFHPT